MPNSFDEFDGDAPVAVAKRNAFDEFDGGNAFDEFDDQSPGAVAGTVNEFRRGLLTGQQALVAAELERAPKAPTMRQLRKGYVTAMSDPRYNLALTLAADNPAKLQRVEETLGPTAQVGRVESAIRLNRQFIAEDVAKLEAEAQAIPASAAMTEWNNADNSNWAKVLAKNPFEITAGIMAQSFPAMSPALAATVVAPGGTAGRAIAAGAGSYGVESAHAFLDSARQTGYDFTDPAKVQEFFDNPEAQAKARAYAQQRGVPIAVLDALTAGLAGKFVGPVLKQGAGKVLVRSGAEIGMQAAGGATGEAAAQLNTGKKLSELSAKDIVAEALGEMASGPVEAYSNLRQGRAGRAATAPPGPSAPGRPMDDELPPAPPVAVETRMEDGGSKIEPTPIAEAPSSIINPPSSPTAPVPEDPRTITAQMQMLVDGKRSAVLITEGEAMPVIPEGDRFATVELEGYGTMIYNKRLHKEETILQRAKEDKLGRILGYGVDRKPPAGAAIGVVTVRTPEGIEKQAVVTDQENLESVTKAAEKVADPQDTVQLEPAEQVIEERSKVQSPKSNGAATEPAPTLAVGRGTLDVPVTERHLREARQALEVERPPSVHDDISGQVTPGPVRFPEADFRDMLDTVRDELAQEQFQKPYKKLRKTQREAVDKLHRISVTEGLPANQVLKGISVANPKYAEWSIDDLAEALSRPAVQTEDSAQVKALAEEIARAEMQAAPANAAEDPWADTIDQLLTDAIAATNLNQAQTLEGVTGAPVWLTKAALNGLLRIIRATYRGTRSLAQAIQAGIEWLRAQNLPNFSETEIKAWLETKITVTPKDDDINIREFTDQLEADQALPPDPARMVANLLYDRRTNESDAAFAMRVMEAVGGPAQAVDVFTDATNGLPGSVRMFLGQLIIKAFGVAGQHDAAARFYDETFAAHVTDTAQSLQALSAFLALTPEGKLIWARRKIERAARDLVAPVQPQLDEAKKQLDETNRTGIEQTTASPDVQEAARQAVDTALEKQAATPGTELSEAIRKEVLDQLVKAGLLTEREAEIFRLHLEGTADNSTLAEKLQRAGIPLHDKRADAINQLYKARTKTEREKIRSRARKARQQQTAREAVKGDESAIDLAIKRAMKELRVQFGQVIRQHHTVADATGQTLAEKIAAASGLNEADARKLAEAVAKRFAALVTARKKAALEKLLKPVKRISRPQLVERLIERSNLGALNQEQFWNAVRANLDLPAWSNELADRIRAQVDSIERVPADQIERKQKAQTELLNMIERAKGIDALDLGLAFYITNILTGITTHLKNVGSTFLNATSAIGTEAARSVATGQLDDIPLLLEAIGEGVKRGKLAAGDVLRTGVVTGSRLGKIEPGRALELTRFGQRGGVPARNAVTRSVLENRLARILNLWKYNFRLMAAEDLLFFKPAEEAKAAVLAKRIARSEGLSGEAAQDRARTILGYGLKAVETAKAQAMQEGLTGSAANAPEQPQIDWTGKLDYSDVTGTPVQPSQSQRNYAGELASQNPDAVRALQSHLQSEYARALSKLGIQSSIYGKSQSWTLWDIGKQLFILKTPSASNPNYRLANPFDDFQIQQEIVARMVGWELEHAKGVTNFPPSWKLTEIGRSALAGSQFEQGRFTSPVSKKVETHQPKPIVQPSKSAVARRTAEILNNNRPLELREDARQFALRTTFNNEPYGAMGAVSHLLNQAKASPNTKLRLAANLITPFTNIIANVVNESLNYTPVGILRARWNGEKLLGYERAQLTVQQQADLKAELYAKALVGTTLLTALALKSAGDLDDEDPDFAIYGSGPASPTDRQGLEAKGWLAHSIKIGDRYYSYANTPLAIPMAWLGGINDRLRDARLFQNRSAQRTADSLPLMAASSAVGMGKVITEQSFMTGLMDLAQTVSEPSPEASGRSLLKQAVRTASSVAVPNAVRQVDKFFDPAQYEQRTAEGILVNAIPFVRGAVGQPVLNAIGLPVQMPLSRQFTSEQATADPLVKLLAETGNWPTMPDRNHIYPRTGRTMNQAEYYEFVKGSGEIMRTELKDLVRDKSWSTLTAEEQGKMISETVSTAREMWRADNGW